MTTRSDFLSKLTSKYSIYLILLVMLVICSLLSPAFFSASWAASARA